MGTESTVSLFRPLLQRPDDNPCATLITCYINAVEEAREEDGTAPDGEISKLREYMPEPSGRPLLERAAWAMTTMPLVYLVRDLDKCFDL